MKMSDFLKTWEGAEVENKWSRMFIAVLVVTVLFLSVQLAGEDKIVALQPVTLSEEAWLTSNKASQSYKEAWGMFLAQLTGNVTPTTVGFIKKRISPLLAPNIYGDVIDALEEQSQAIKNDRISLRFEPRTVEYEESTGKVFVYGYSFESGATGGESKSDRTYEYIIKISNYAPLITHINTYQGQPRSSTVLQQIKQREEDQKKRIRQDADS